MALEIVIVEDSEDDVALLRRALSGLNHWECTVTSFGVCSDALGYLSKLESSGKIYPDLLVLDLQLPDGSGTKFLKNLRATAPHLDHLPVAVVSNHFPLRQQIEPGSVQACFEKPFRYDEWKALASQLCQLASSKSPAGGDARI